MKPIRARWWFSWQETSTIIIAICIYMQRKKPVKGTSGHFFYYHPNKLKQLTDILRKNYLAVALVSFVWLLFRTGQKPSRISYPCQKAASMNLGFFGYMVIYAPVSRILHIFQYEKKKILKFTVVAFLTLALLMAADGLWSSYHTENELHKYKSQNNIGPVGKPLTVFGGIITQYSTIPHALSLPSPHRVVSIYDPDATNWIYCNSGCPYYGDNIYVNQTIVDRMVDRGVMELTGTANVSDAWAAIIPNYKTGEKIAIKLNFNDAIIGGGNPGYGDNDAYVDAIPQPINSIIRGLKSIGVHESDIWIYDASRYVTDRFRNRISYSNISYFDHYGNGNDVHLATFNSLDPTAQINFSGSGYGGNNKVTDVLVNATYLINVPIFKRHGGSGITLSLKNHLGSIDGFYNGEVSGDMHDYIYFWGNGYRSSSNPLVNINNNIHIKNKTVLIIGDALYGAWPTNNEPPRRWISFGSDSPNMLLFSADPVAVDSVMYDYLQREDSFDARSEDVLIVAANADLGVHERWNNNIDRRYNTIDYIDINMTDEPYLSSVSVSLISPSNGIISNNNVQTFNCSATSGLGLSNITLFGNWSGTWNANETKTIYGLKNSTTFMKTIDDGQYKWNCIAYDIVGNSNFAPTNFTFAIDVTPPSSVTNLTNITNNQTYINWTWADPSNIDFSYVSIYLDGSFKTNISKSIQYYNATNLFPNTTHTLSTRTVDSNGNINQTWVNDTVSTRPIESPPFAKCGPDKLNCENIFAPVQFNGSSSYDHDGVVVSYYWEFGDDTSEMDAAPKHAYDKYRWNGTAYLPFIVNLTVTDNDGLTNRTSQGVIIWMAGDANGDGTVDILDASIAGLRWNSSDPCADLNNDGKVNILDVSIIGLNWKSKA